jgi:hypothetical protein
MTTYRFAWPVLVRVASDLVGSNGLGVNPGVELDDDDGARYLRWFEGRERRVLLEAVIVDDHDHFSVETPLHDQFGNETKAVVSLTPVTVQQWTRDYAERYGVRFDTQEELERWASFNLG